MKKILYLLLLVSSTVFGQYKIPSINALLRPPAGTSVAGTAPLKFISGTALTTPSDGAWEYYGGHIYFTIGSTRYQIDQQGGGSSSYAFNSGLTEVSGVVRLGGTLTNSAVINGNSLYTFDVTNATSSTFSTTGNINLNGVVITPSAASATTPGSVLSTGTAGIGYATGAGGVVTQSGNKSSGVTLNKITGRITMAGSALAAGNIVSFTLTNSTIAANDVIIVNHAGTGTVGAYLINVQAGAGNAVVNVRNTSAASLSEAIVISFAVIKSVNN